MKNWNIIEELYEDEIMELTVTIYELVDEHIQYYILEMHDPLFKDKFCYVSSVTLSREIVLI